MKLEGVKPGSRGDVELSKSMLEFTRKALETWLETWEDCIGEEKLRRITCDYSSIRPGYTLDVVECENVRRPDEASVSERRIRETWDGGERVIRLFSNGETKIDLRDGGVDISTTLTEGGLYQKTVCKLGMTKVITWRPLIVGEETFFAVTDPLPFDAYFREEVYAQYHGDRIISSRYLVAMDCSRISADEDRYVTTLVTSYNGLVEYGTVEHGSGIGLVVPKTYPVE